MKGDNVLAQSTGAVAGEAMGMLSTAIYGKPVEQLTEQEKATVSAFPTLAAGIAGGLVGDSTHSATTAAQAGKTTVENNYLSSKQIDTWSAEMKTCHASGGDCDGIIKKYEELSTAQ